MLDTVHCDDQSFWCDNTAPKDGLIDKVRSIGGDREALNVSSWPTSASRDGQEAVLSRRSVMSAYALLLALTKGG